MRGGERERNGAMLAAQVIRLAYLEPERYTVPQVAERLRAGERRVQRVLKDIEVGGWDVERDGRHRLTIRPAVIVPPEG